MNKHKQIIQKLVNEWYKPWLQTNDHYQTDFKLILEETLPDYSFTKSHDQWIIL